MNLVYVLPSVLNKNGQIYSVAELVATGYASFVSDGTSPSSKLEFSRFFIPQRCKVKAFPPVNNMLLHDISVSGPGVPSMDPYDGRFTNGFQTNDDSYETGADDATDSRDKYGSETSNYDTYSQYKRRRPYKTVSTSRK